MEFSEEEEEPVINNGVETVQFTEGDAQLPTSSNALISNSSASIKPAATSLTVFSEDLPPHKDEDVELTVSTNFSLIFDL